MTAISKDTFQFLKNLKKNNDREWFNKNKSRFLAANENFMAFVDDLILKISKFDSSLEGLKAKDTIFRIYRDTRFSPDKTPYKTHFGAVLKGKQDYCGIAGYYLHLEPGNTFLAGGVHMSETAQLNAIRGRISEEAELFNNIISDKQFISNFTIEGEKLKNVPRGFEKDDKMADYLKYKQLVIINRPDDSEVFSADFSNYCTKVYKQMVPFNSFINEAVGELA